MSDFAEELLAEALREVTRRTVGSIYDYFVNNTRSKFNAQSGATLYHIGTTFFMGNNSMLYYNFENNSVVGYNLNKFGDRWMETTIRINEDPNQFTADGGVAYVRKFYVDDYGNRYTSD